MAGLEPKEEIRARCNIVEIVEGYIPLKKAGATFKACCPFHKEKTPSFNVDPRRQIFHCFGCGAGGDIFSFVMKQEGVDFPTALRILGRQVGVEVDNQPQATRTGLDKESLYQVLSGLAAFYARTLKDSKLAEGAREYLMDRRMDEALCKTFQMGYAPDRWDTCMAWAKKHGFTEEQLEATGMLSRKEEGGRGYDRFRDRLMFPIHDELGRVIGFSGRVLPSNDSPAKYINSPEGPLFHKSRVLFALDKARQSIAQKRQALLCEGQIDVIRCHQAGIDHAVAALGTALTPDHARILKRYTDEVIMVLDGDTAGENAALRGAEPLLHAELSPRAVALPKGQDPDTLILEKGGDALSTLINSAASMIDFQFNVLHAREPVHNDAAYTRIARELLKTISHASSSFQQDRYLQQAANLLKSSLDVLKSDLRTMQSRKHRQTSAYNDEPPPFDDFRADDAEIEDLPDLPLPSEETTLIELFIHHSDLHEEAIKHLPEQVLQHPLTLQVIAHIKSSPGKNLEDLISTLAEQNPALAPKLTGLIVTGKGETTGHIKPREALRDTILVIRRRALERKRSALEEQLTHEYDAFVNEECSGLTYHIIKLNEARRSQRWEDALPILEAY